MAKLTSFENPVSGDKGNLLDLGMWGRLILGSVVFFVALGVGKTLFDRLRGLAPGPVQGALGTGALPVGVVNFPAPRADDQMTARRLHA